MKVDVKNIMRIYGFGVRKRNLIRLKQSMKMRVMKRDQDQENLKVNLIYKRNYKIIRYNGSV